MAKTIWKRDWAESRNLDTNLSIIIIIVVIVIIYIIISMFHYFVF